MGAHIFKQHGTETQIAGGRIVRTADFRRAAVIADVESVEVDAHTLAESKVGEEGRRLHTDRDALVVVGSGGGMDVAEHKRLVEIAGDVVGHDNAFKNDVFFDFLEGIVAGDRRAVLLFHLENGGVGRGELLCGDERTRIVGHLVVIHARGEGK